MGVTKEIIRPGPAGALVPQKGDTIIIHYTGTLEDGKKFDSSVDRGTPFETPIGVSRVIKGWDVGILGGENGIVAMRVGEKAKLTITHDYAYGERGFPPVIPPAATLIFEVELIGIKGKEEL
ncbi:FK506-binding protein 1A [Orbilia blumenaviensis]|uniref:peptidylprolyl isomerase n=1 Tax=Orbilia blumenaviensis TaxID=1796055 RepID=A0AAV9VL79_9PEZI